MQNSPLVQIVDKLDAVFPKNIKNISSIFREVKNIKQSDFKKYDQKQLVTAFNLFIARKFVGDIDIENRITPPVIGDLAAVVLGRLGFIADNSSVYSPSISFPDFAFQVCSHFESRLFIDSDSSSITENLPALAALFGQSFKKSSQYDLILTRFLGIDFKKELNSFLKLDLLRQDGVSLLVINDVDLQSSTFLDFIKTNDLFDLLSIIRLPQTLFKHRETASSLLILRRKGDNKKVKAPVLLAQIPELTKKKEFSDFLNQLDDWKKDNL
ncbi:DNA methyltransferase [Oenococcus alcoholitolerans]|uniref:DNA methylase adenine-specific domain-containing protein n=1 Tax=Oenococcus alcoholitolerans TaxID=931074 RepID=A0ABR4XRR6_9LACO|nr:hypothetical protein Q757_02585 [Oenococcus alcoholitolerans]